MQQPIRDGRISVLAFPQRLWMLQRFGYRGRQSSDRVGNRRLAVAALAALRDSQAIAPSLAHTSVGRNTPIGAGRLHPLREHTVLCISAPAYLPKPPPPPFFEAAFFALATFWARPPSILLRRARVVVGCGPALPRARISEAEASRSMGRLADDAPPPYWARSSQ